MPGTFSQDPIKTAKDAMSAERLTPPSTRSLQMLVLKAFREESLRWPARMLHPLGPEVAKVHALKIDLMLRETPPIIHAIGVGNKIVQGTPTGTKAVKVYVTRKVKPREVSESDRIPPTINGVPTDVVEAPPATLLAAAGAAPCTQNRAAANRPLIAGVSTSHIAGETGTLGYFCRSTDPNDSPSNIFVLSTAHIYANYGAAQPGEDLIQQGAADGGLAASRIAGFHRTVPLVFGGARNDGDAAMGKLANVPYRLEICSIGPVNGAIAAVEGDAVAKHGRTSGYTEGVVDDDSIDFIMLSNDLAGYIKFQDQMRIVPRTPYAIIAQGGESGSVVVKRPGHQAVGLLHAAANDGSYAYANHIQPVMNLLRIALDVNWNQRLMAESLQAVKDRISERYLGKSGIHAVGLRRSANAITVYFKPTADPAQQQTLESLRQEASPYNVITKEAVDAEFRADSDVKPILFG